jgi:hypothetical protein
MEMPKIDFQKNNDLNVVEPYKNKDKFKYEFRDNDFNYFDKNLEN